MASWDNPELEQVEIDLDSVQVIDINKIENTAKLEVTFMVKNPSDKTFTIPMISYELFADGQSLGSGQYSTEDIAMPGRAVFYSGAGIPLDSTFVIAKSNVGPIYESIISENVARYSAKGVITAETSWSLVEKEFDTRLN